MGVPVAFEEANVVLGPPADDPQVLRLPIRRGGGQLVSCWRLNAAELAEIARTGVVWISVAGAQTQPPIWAGGLKAEALPCVAKAG